MDYLKDFSNARLKSSRLYGERISIFHREKVRILRLISNYLTATRRAWFIGFSLSGVLYCSTRINFYFGISYNITRRRCTPFVSRWIRHQVIRLQNPILRYARRLTMRTVFWQISQVNRRLMDGWRWWGAPQLPSPILTKQRLQSITMQHCVCCFCLFFF